MDPCVILDRISFLISSFWNRHRLNTESSLHNIDCIADYNHNYVTVVKQALWELRMLTSCRIGHYGFKEQTRLTSCRIGHTNRWQKMIMMMTTWWWWWFFLLWWKCYYYSTVPPFSSSSSSPSQYWLLNSLYLCPLFVMMMMMKILLYVVDDGTRYKGTTARSLNLPAHKDASSPQWYWILTSEKPK